MLSPFGKKRRPSSDDAVGPNSAILHVFGCCVGGHVCEAQSGFPWKDQHTLHAFILNVISSWHVKLHE